MPSPDMDGPSTITVISTAFADGEPVPTRYTCDGDNVSPPLWWHGVPADAEALALVVDDPDAPRGTFTHWVVLDVPTDVTAVDEAGTPAGGGRGGKPRRPVVVLRAVPPSGTHHYRFTVFALSSPTGLAAGAALHTALRAVHDRASARGRMTGTYRR